VLLALFGLGSGLLWTVGPRPFVAGLVLIAIIAIYDLWHKTNPWSPLVMAAARLMVYVIAYLTYASAVSSHLLLAGGLLVLYVVGLTYIAKRETKGTFTRHWPAALLVLPLPVYGLIALTGPAPLILAPLALFGLWVAYCLSFVYRPSGRGIGGAIPRLIAGMSLLDAVVLAAAGAVAALPLALVAFGATLFCQRYIRGT
jgi:hypothetical protein